MKKALPVVVVALVVAGAFVFVLFVRGDAGPIQGVSQSAAVADADTVGPAPLGTSTPETQAVDQNNRLYRNASFHFSLVYPKGLQVLEYKEQGGALTVTFDNNDESNEQSFEVYVTPYAGTSVSAQRFKSDEPSGTYQDPQNVIIAGAKATMFFGNNPIMGDTREVWFIHGGFLYEVATYKELDTWLGTVMQTWKFL